MSCGDNTGKICGLLAPSTGVGTSIASTSQDPAILAFNIAVLACAIIVLGLFLISRIVKRATR